MSAVMNMVYLRVPVSDQDTEKIRNDIYDFCDEKAFGDIGSVEETVSGTVNWRQRKIGRLIRELKAGDRLIVPELSGLGRSMPEIMEILSVAMKKGIRVYAVRGSWELDNASIQSKNIATVFAMAAEIERDLRSLLTKEGLKARKAQGVKLGRPKGVGKSKLDIHREEIVSLLKVGVPKSRVAKKYDTTLPNLYNWLKKNNIVTEA